MKKILLSVFIISLFLGCSSKEASTKTLHNNDKAMYQKFLMKKAGEDLDKELEKQK